ncbi:hypothetical protein ACGFX2_20840 [Streptomyces goshikiensis]|uniref:hypothetical protein n=1 Tax=Streptomyces goshikiensis TaxID=1942 RepID=UPI00371D1C10
MRTTGSGAVPDPALPVGAEDGTGLPVGAEDGTVDGEGRAEADGGVDVPDVPGAPGPPAPVGSLGSLGAHAARPSTAATPAATHARLMSGSRRPGGHPPPMTETSRAAHRFPPRPIP